MVFYLLLWVIQGLKMGATLNGTQQDAYVDLRYPYNTFQRIGYVPKPYLPRILYISYLQLYMTVYRTLHWFTATNARLKFLQWQDDSYICCIQPKVPNSPLPTPYSPLGGQPVNVFAPLLPAIQNPPSSSAIPHSVIHCNHSCSGRRVHTYVVYNPEYLTPPYPHCIARQRVSQ